MKDNTASNVSKYFKTYKQCTEEMLDSITDNQGISVDENPLEDMGNKEQEKIEVSEKEG